MSARLAAVWVATALVASPAVPGETARGAPSGRAAAEAHDEGPGRVAAVAALRFGDGRWLRVEVPAPGPPSGDGVGEAGSGEVEAAWVWSEDHPPRTVDPGRWRAELERLRSQARAGPPARLAVEIVPSCAPRCGDLVLVAAPRAMWEEVEEPWLPRWPVSEVGRVEVPWTPGEPWRVRLVGEGRGGWWRDVEGSEDAIPLRPVAARSVPLSVRSATGEELEGFSVTLLRDEPSGYRSEILAKVRSPTGTRVVLPALPVDGRAVWLASARGHVSWGFVGRGEDLPDPIVLPAGGRATGRFVDSEGQAIAGVEVVADGWTSPVVPIPTHLRATSDEVGRWALSPLPAGPIALRTSKSGLRSLSARFEARPGITEDLGEIELVPGATLRVEVVDAADGPVPGAEVAAAGAPPRWTDRDGLATVHGLAPGSRVELRVASEGSLPVETAVAPPWPEAFRVRLRRGLRVIGRYVTAEGVPVGDAMVRIETESSFRRQPLAPSGELDVLLEPGREHALELSSPHTAPTRIAIPPGEAGELRDLGSVQATLGMIVTGRLVQALDGAPVPGARVWTPRLRDHGSSLAWALGDTVATSSDAAGEFRLTGIAPRPLELAIDASGLARRYVVARPPEGGTSIDLGTVELAVGATVVVDAPDLGPSGEVLQAHLDLRGRWREQDMMLATVVDGAAEFLHVPAGTALLTIVAGRELVCEESVAVPEGEPRIEVVCDEEGRRVAGGVLVGDRPAGPGILVWRPPPVEGLDAAIFNLEGAGIRQQRTVGVGRPSVAVDVATDGSFASDRVGGGRWEVTWQPHAGPRSAPLEVEVPSGGGSGLLLRFAGAVLTGRVTDEEGGPLAGAVISEVGAGTTALSAEDGSFRLMATGRGSARLQARWRDRYSPLVEVALEEGTAEEVELTVRRSHGGRVPVVVWDENGLPAAGALVFYETDAGGSLRVVSADRDGRLDLSFPAPLPERLRLAAFTGGRWTLGDWLHRDDAGEGTSLTLGETGGMTLSVTDGAGGRVTIQGPGGWDVSRLLAVLGASLEVDPERPLEVVGLPPGIYTVGVPPWLRTARVEADEVVEVEVEVEVGAASPSVLR